MLKHPNRLALNQNEKTLLECTAGDLIPELIDNPTLLHVKQTAFEHYDAKSGHAFQVQVTVTRDASEFLEPFQVEELSGYKKP